jgi:cell division protein FtsL
MMEYQVLFNSAVAMILMLSGWVLRTIWDAMNSLKSDIREIEKNLSGAYVRKDDYRDDIKEMKEMLRVIFEKLDSKVDKGS